MSSIGNINDALIHLLEPFPPFPGRIPISRPFPSFDSSGFPCPQILSLGSFSRLSGFSSFGSFPFSPDSSSLRDPLPSPRDSLPSGSSSLSRFSSSQILSLGSSPSDFSPSDSLPSDPLLRFSSLGSSSQILSPIEDPLPRILSLGSSPSDPLPRDPLSRILSLGSSP